MQIRLTVTAGPDSGRVFTFTNHDTFLVGRSKHAHFQLPPSDRYCSRIHFMIEVNPPHCRLVDMGSNNGTFVNGKKVPKADLADGDEIRAGHNSLRVHIEKDSEPSPEPEEREETRSWHEEKVRSPEVTGLTDLAQVESVTPRQDPPGEFPCIPGYELTSVLGEGGMGTVYQAINQAGEIIALKTIKPAITSQRKIERFLREARILCELVHPHIVAFREMGESNGLLYFVMEQVAGGNVEELLRQGGALPIGRAVSIIMQVLDALEHAHTRQFVHRDVKPSNMLLTTEEGNEVVKLADFGLARAYEASELSGLTVTGEMGGTPQFMPPEQITRFRESPPSVDQYAAAASLYHLLTGKYLYEARGSDLITAILHDKPIPVGKHRPDVPAGLATVIHRALAREPGNRFASVGIFRRALTPFAS